MTSCWSGWLVVRLTGLKQGKRLESPLPITFDLRHCLAREKIAEPIFRRSPRRRKKEKRRERGTKKKRIERGERDGRERKGRKQIK